MSLAERFRGLLGIHTTSKWIVLAAIVGLAAGLGAVAFQLLSQAIMTGTLGHLGGYSAPEPMGEHQWISYDGGGFSIWLVALIVVCGGVGTPRMFEEVCTAGARGAYIKFPWERLPRLEPGAEG